MAKKKSVEPKEQTTIPGAVDEVSRRVRDSARAYARTVNKRMSLQADEAVMKPSLDNIMEEDDVHQLEVSFSADNGDTLRYRVKRGTKEVTKITCKKLDEEKGEVA